jgi:opacity protein-like surface antigen
MNKNLYFLVVAILATLFSTSAEAEEISRKAADLMPKTSLLSNNPTNQDSHSSNLLAQNNYPLGDLTDSKVPASNYWYVSGSLGLAFPNDMEISNPDSENLGTISLNSGLQLAAAGGYQWKNARAELEIGFRSLGADKLNIPNNNESELTGNIKQTTFLINGYYDIPTKSKFRPYLGAGVGIGLISEDVTFEGQTAENNNNTSFAYQGKVGVQYEVTKKGNAFVELKYLSIGSYTDEDNNKSGPFNSTALSVGYRQGF